MLTEPAPAPRRPTALLLCGRISQRLELQRELEAQGYLVAARRSARDVALCHRVYRPSLIVVDGAWLDGRSRHYGLLESLGRQTRLVVVEAGGRRLPRAAHRVAAPAPGR